MLKPAALIILGFVLGIAATFIHAASPIEDPGMQMLGVENYTGAQAYFQDQLQKDPKNAAATADMAKVYLAEGQSKTGVEWVQKAIAIAPNDATYQLLLGDAYGIYINDVGFFSKLGVAHKILAAYQQAVQLDPNSADAHSSLATYYIVAPGMAGGSTDKANEQILILDKIDPIQAANARARMALKDKDYQKAEEYLRSAVKLDKTGKSDLQLGLVLGSQKHYSEAIAAFEDGIQKDPTDSSNYYQVGRAALIGNIHIQEGIEDLQKYLTMPHDWRPDAPTYKWAHYRLGMLYGIAGDKTNEKAQFEAALKFDPDFKEVKKALADM
jgi:tetratricopeptide (TPR) repeat protein